MDAHEVLDECVADWVCGFNLLVTIVSIGHFECKLALSVDALGSGLIVLVQDGEGVVLPIEISQCMEPVLILVKVFIAKREQIRPVDAELVAVLIVRPCCRCACCVSEGRRRLIRVAR